MSTRPPLERWSPRALIGFPAFCDQNRLGYVLFTEGFSSFGSPCQVANSQSRHEVLKVVALGELIFAGDEVSGHGADQMLRSLRCCCVETSVISREQRDWTGVSTELGAQVNVQLLSCT